MPHPLPETPRLRLRELHDGDAPFLLELLNDPDFIANIADRGVRSEDDARAYLATGIDAFFTDDPALGRKAVDGTWYKPLPPEPTPPTDPTAPTDPA